MIIFVRSVLRCQTSLSHSMSSCNTLAKRTHPHVVLYDSSVPTIPLVVSQLAHSHHSKCSMCVLEGNTHRARQLGRLGMIYPIKLTQDKHRIQRRTAKVFNFISELRVNIYTICDPHCPTMSVVGPNTFSVLHFAILTEANRNRQKPNKRLKGLLPPSPLISIRM